MINATDPPANQLATNNHAPDDDPYAGWHTVVGPSTQTLYVHDHDGIVHHITKQYGRPPIAEDDDAVEWVLKGKHIRVTKSPVTLWENDKPFDLVPPDNGASPGIRPETAQRLQAKAAGFDPLPLIGKRPLYENWTQVMHGVSEDAIKGWEQDYPLYRNTGLLTRRTPAIDIDIMAPDAAGAVEEFARECFAESGRIAIRFGMRPKRALLLRTDEPFPKWSVNLIGPNGAKHKIEILGDGAQLVAFGIHPETRKPYEWFPNAPGAFLREELPYVRKEDVQAFVDGAIRLLTTEFGFKLASTSEKKPANGINHSTDPNWAPLYQNITTGANYHDSLVILAAKLVASGTNDGAIVNQLKGLMLAIPEEARDQRWKERFAEIPRIVSSARGKFGRPHVEAPGVAPDEGPQPGPDEGPPPWGDPVSAPPPRYTPIWHGDVSAQELIVWGIKDLIPEVGTGIISGQWGTYKTFLAFDIAVSYIAKRPFICDRFPVVRQGGVLFIAAEGQNQVPIRLEAALREHAGYTAGQKAPFVWVKERPNLQDPNAGKELLELINGVDREMRQRFSVPLVACFIDTMAASSGYKKQGEENDAAVTQVIYGCLTDVAMKAGIFLFGVDHLGKEAETGTRGSSNKEAAVDVILALKGKKNLEGQWDGPVTLSLRKRRSGENGESFEINTRSVPVGYETTLVMDWQIKAKPEPTSADKKKHRPTVNQIRLRKALFEALDSYGKMTVPRGGMSQVKCIQESQLRTEFYRVHPGEPEAQRKAYTRTLDQFDVLGFVGLSDGLVWFAKDWS